MTRKLSRAVATTMVAALPLLAGCGSSDPDFYSLSPWPGLAQPGAPASVEVRGVSLASALDRDRIVQSDAGYKLKLDDDAAWAEPLGDMVGRVLTADLQQRLPGSNVYGQGGAISAQPDAVVELDVRRFAGDGHGQARLQGLLSVHRLGGGTLGTTPLDLSAPLDGQRAAALVAALSTLMGQVADQAAARLHQLPPPPLVSGGVADGVAGDAAAAPLAPVAPAPRSPD